MLKIYFDTCSLQRPLDSKSQIRILLEAEAILNLLGQCEAGRMTLIGSDILAFETERNPNLTRREYATEILRKAKQWVALDESIENRARALNALAFKPLDALHLAAAEAAEADYFCTCDDRLLKRARSLKALRIPVLSPLDLIGEIEK